MIKSKFLLAPLLCLAIGMPILGFAKSSNFSAGFSSPESSSDSSSSKPVHVAPTSPSAKPSGFTSPAKGFSSGVKPSPSTVSSDGSKPSPAAVPVVKSNSALSQSLQNSAANSRALAALDARNAKKAVVTGAVVGVVGGTIASNTGTTVNTDTNGTTGQTNHSSPVNPNYQPPAPVVVRDSGSDMMGNAMWFMMGRSISNERTVHVNNGQSSTSNSTSSNGYAPSKVNGNQAEEDDGFGATILRIFLWLLIIGAVILGVLWYKARRDAANGVSKSKRNYSL